MEKVAGFEIVEQFLDNWKAESVKWYAEQYEKYLADKEYRKNNPSKADQLYKSVYSPEKEAEIEQFLAEHFEKNEKGYWLVPNTYRGYGFRAESSYNALVSIMNDEYAKFQDRWSHVIKHIGKKVSYSESVEMMLQREYERKYEKLVNDVQKITGNVEQADLKIGATRNIEGFIVGCNGKAELWSTFVWGDIQCPHFRFYCHRR